ncbi:hypothetical protein BLNAU_8416 [Blattamonas nauphoetae]|uniref:Uncharacterized protein n=1 Tax=Blattamonas nauphoetae TaxID=2049346 RepID=A0ABQ9XYL8_9EUKA|nr:hypothetical protein BLNAU_8416 [Blattamonas nauphoetae]
MDKSYFKQLTGSDIDVFHTDGKHFDKHYEHRTVATFLDTKLKHSFSNRQLLQFTPAHSSQASHLLFNTTLQRLTNFSDIFLLIKETEDKAFIPAGLVTYDHLQSLHKHHPVGKLKAAPHRTKLTSDKFLPIHPSNFPLTLSMQDPGKMLSTFMKKELKKDELLQKESQENEQPYTPNELVMYLQSNSGPDLQKRFTDTLRNCIRRMNSRKSELVPYLKCSSRYKPEKKRRGGSSSGDDSEERKKEARKEKLKQKKNKGLVDSEYGYLVPLSFVSDDITYCDCCLSITRQLPDDDDEEDSSPEKAGPQMGCQVLAHAVYPIEEGFLLASQFGRIDATWLIESFKRKMMKDMPRPTAMVALKHKERRKEEKRPETKQEKREKKRLDLIRKRGFIPDPIDDIAVPHRLRRKEKQGATDREESEEEEESRKRERMEERRERREEKMERRKEKAEKQEEEEPTLKPATFDLSQLKKHHYKLKKRGKGYILVQSGGKDKDAPGIEMENEENLEEADSKEEGIEVKKDKEGKLMIRDESGKLRRIHIHQKEGRPVFAGMTKKQQAVWKAKDEQRKVLELEEKRTNRENDDKTVQFSVEWLWQQLAQPALSIENAHLAETVDGRAHFEGTIMSHHAKWMNQIRMEQWAMKNDAAGFWGIEELKQRVQGDERGGKSGRRARTRKPDDDSLNKVYQPVFNLTSNVFDAVEFSSDSSCDSFEDGLYRTAMDSIRKRLERPLSKEDEEAQEKCTEEALLVLMEKGASDVSSSEREDNPSTPSIADSEDEELRELDSPRGKVEMNEELELEKLLRREKKEKKTREVKEDDWLVDYELNSGWSEEEAGPNVPISAQVEGEMINYQKKHSFYQNNAFGVLDVVDGMMKLNLRNRKGLESTETAKEETIRMAMMRGTATREEREGQKTVLFDHPMWMGNHAAVSATVSGVMNDLEMRMRADREIVLKRTETLRPPPTQPQPQNDALPAFVTQLTNKVETPTQPSTAPQVKSNPSDYVPPTSGIKTVLPLPTQNPVSSTSQNTSKTSVRPLSPSQIPAPLAPTTIQPISLQSLTNSGALKGIKLPPTLLQSQTTSGKTFTLPANTAAPKAQIKPFQLPVGGTQPLPLVQTTGGTRPLPLPLPTSSAGSTGISTLPFPSGLIGSEGEKQEQPQKPSPPTPKPTALPRKQMESIPELDKEEEEEKASPTDKQCVLSLLNNTDGTTGDLKPFPKQLAPAIFHTFDSLAFLLSFIHCVVEEKAEVINSEDERREKRRKEKIERYEQKRKEREEKRKKKEEERRQRKAEEARARGEPVSPEPEPEPEKKPESEPEPQEVPIVNDLPPNSLKADMDGFLAKINAEAADLELYVSLAKRKKRMVKYLERRGKRIGKLRRRNARRRRGLSRADREMRTEVGRRESEERKRIEFEDMKRVEEAERREKEDNLRLVMGQTTQTGTHSPYNPHGRDMLITPESIVVKSVDQQNPQQMSALALPGRKTLNSGFIPTLGLTAPRGRKGPKPLPKPDDRENG